MLYLGPIVPCCLNKNISLCVFCILSVMWKQQGRWVLSLREKERAKNIHWTIKLILATSYNIKSLLLNSEKTVHSIKSLFTQLYRPDQRVITVEILSYHVNATSKLIKQLRGNCLRYFIIKQALNGSWSAHFLAVFPSPGKDISCNESYLNLKDEKTSRAVLTSTT